MENIDYFVGRLFETKNILKEQREKNKIYNDRINSIINEIEPKIKVQLEKILLEVVKESGNSMPNNFKVGIISPEGSIQGMSLPFNRCSGIGKILGYISYHGYLNKYDIDDEFIDKWVDKRFKEKLSELGIPEEYVSGIEIDAEYPK